LRALAERSVTVLRRWERGAVRVLHMCVHVHVGLRQGLCSSARLDFRVLSIDAL
jgi:hypothetical protein